MGNLVENRVVAGPPPNSVGWPVPALIASGPLAQWQEPALRRAESSVAAFVRWVARAVAPAVGPGAAALSLESCPIPHPGADRGARVLPTYLRHQEVSA
jgi:hypothetical protein